MVGAPVRDEHGRIVGGLSIGGPKYRIDVSRINEELADQLLNAVDSLEKALRSEGGLT